MERTKGAAIQNFHRCIGQEPDLYPNVILHGERGGRDGPYLSVVDAARAGLADNTASTSNRDGEQHACVLDSRHNWDSGDRRGRLSHRQSVSLATRIHRYEGARRVCRAFSF